VQWHSASQLLVLPIGGGRGLPECWEVLRAPQHRLLLLGAHREVGLALRLGVRRLKRLQGLELRVPAPLELGGHPAVVGVHRMALTLGELHLAARLLELALPLAAQGGCSCSTA
jgi:hypothetical protein